MIKKYQFGKPIETGATVLSVQPENGPLPYFERSEDGLVFTLKLEPADKIYGLGESVRGMNKRGFTYTSWCSDDPNHTENKNSLYGAHNFLLFMGSRTFGVFFDYPGKITFDLAYTDIDVCTITASDPDMDIWFIDGEKPLDIALEFRKIIGSSYIPPRWAFGYQQSRWGYRNADDIRRLVESFRANGLPLDSVYMDIDYMDNFKDFTVSSEAFPDFPEFVKEMRAQHVRLVPIIDAGVKIEKGYETYEEGTAGDFFCKTEDGKPFVAGVWPGLTHFPDFFKPETRKWFGHSYYKLTDAGIEGFWNDMNEPAIFYSSQQLDIAKKRIDELLAGELNISSYFELKDTVNSLGNHPEDYRRFYHEIDGKRIRHDKVHNLFGYNMTRAAGEAFLEKYPDKRLLLFSRASYPGMHRYGGIWTGDNQSWWSHLLLNIKMMPALNMMGFLYSGADLGGFGSDTTADLLLRWLAFGVFTPLMRNHSALGTREQEPFRFGKIPAFKRILDLRYRLLGYIYSEFMKAALSDGLLFRPLCFDYPEDSFAPEVEDQLMFGEGLMLTPVYEQNAKGRYVYLPEDMLFIRFISEEAAAVAEESELRRLSDGTPYLAKAMPAGHHYIDVALDEVPVFLRPNRILPLLAPAAAEELLDFDSPELIAYPHGKNELTYDFYCDDGFSRSYDAKTNRRVLLFTK